MNKFLSTLFICCLALFASSKEIPHSPEPARLINDFAKVIGPADANQLESKLKTYFDSTSTQIVVVIENTLEGDDIFDYCQRLAQSWGIGNKDKNNGVLLYIAIDDRKIRIHTGYGMEATITDALSKRIINEIIKPYFKQALYAEGIDAATTAIMQAAAGEFINDLPKHKKNELSLFQLLLILGVLLLFFIFRNKGGGRNGGFRRGFGTPYYGSFGSGGFSGGDSGFGGFGGGSFGGGGSSGSW